MAEQTNEERILENALAPKRASGDAGSMEQHSIADQIAADQYKAAKEAAQSGGFGIKRSRMIPGNSD